MAAYREKVKAELQNFSRYEVKHIDREDNSNADALAKLATSKGGTSSSSPYRNHPRAKYHKARLGGSDQLGTFVDGRNLHLLEGG